MSIMIAEFIVRSINYPATRGELELKAIIELSIKNNYEHLFIQRFGLLNDLVVKYIHDKQYLKWKYLEDHLNMLLSYLVSNIDRFEYKLYHLINIDYVLRSIKTTMKFDDIDVSDRDCALFIYDIIELLQNRLISVTLFTEKPYDQNADNVAKQIKDILLNKYINIQTV